MEPLDRGTKIYALLLASITLVLLGYWALGGDPRVEQLNRLLQADAGIAAYPFPFRVLRMQGDTAVVSSPRSAEVSVLHALAILEPSLARLDADDPRVIAAQKRLARIQARVRQRLLQAPEVKAVRWELDRAWFRQHGHPLD
ncbi:hypothetical protein QVG61_04450 [Thiohalobacter sp. IOR34]|uniref:hypothetical protein n=1 Tax=Thiohalobacter sp. IOR34 TaxID=3057176 RepID=UPI0025AF718C|nr:hypothetical protein [Thiohalobacter sp. IOR34]WJW76351.1 hypothetical protein QVG61_04450 [Thiohalobacter sp. IOR34]